MRGGYGSAQLLPLLDTKLLRSSAKPLIGYSDITALLSLYLKNGLTAIHGPMVDRRLSKGPAGYHEDSFRRVVMTAAPAGDLRPERLEALHPGSATGVLARRHPDAADGIDGHAVGVRRRRRIACCSSKTSASVRTASIAC